MSRLTLVLVLLFFSTVERNSAERSVHPFARSLSTGRLKEISELTDYDRFLSTILRPINRVRVPGTVGHHKVKMFIKEQFENLSWTVTLDEFDSDTPLGKKRFTNIIATQNPAARRRLILSAHYDSKLMQPTNGEYFLGSIDSAVPCAMLVEIARTLTPYFNEKAKRQASDISLQMVFFDGEEAFRDWTETDSLYGARHLAAQWQDMPLPGAEARSGNRETMLSTINALVLLDLIGAKDPKFYNSFPQTRDLFERMQLIERRLTSIRQIREKRNPYFVGSVNQPLYIEDDHIPFLRRNTSVLHLIPVPFPACWHQMCDHEGSLDENTIHDLIKIIRVFVSEYFSL